MFAVVFAVSAVFFAVLAVSFAVLAVSLATIEFAFASCAVFAVSFEVLSRAPTESTAELIVELRERRYDDCCPVKVSYEVPRVYSVFSGF